EKIRRTEWSAAPALSMVTYEEPRNLDAAIAQTNKYRGIPSPEIDAAWMKIGLGTQAIRLFDDDLKRLNKSDEPMKPLHRIPEEFGGGFLGMLEVFHLLHCLDSLRKASYKEYYMQEWIDVGEGAKRIHDDHCIDMLREYIMCTADVTPITFYDTLAFPSRKLPMPDFSTRHTCRDFDAILEWNENNERSILWDGIGLDLGEEKAVG
ncbi:Cyclochlorotine biosynthesis protein O, partial [Lachnellula arida]